MIAVTASPARAQEGVVDSVPERGAPLVAPRDPFDLGAKKLAYALTLNVAEVYDDNVLLESDATDDWVTVLLLATRLRYEFQGGDVNVDYRARESVYLDHDEFNGLENFLNADGRWTVGRVTLAPSVEWLDMKEPFDALQVTGRQDSVRLGGRMKAIVDFNKWDVEATAGVEHFRIEDVTLENGDYERWEGSIAVVTEAGDQIALFGDFSIHQTDYEEEFFSDITYWRIAVGARGLATAKIRGEALLGLGRAEPQDEELVTSGDFSGIVAEAALTWTPDDVQEVRLDLRRIPQESVVSGLTVADGVRLGYRRVLSPRWAIGGHAAWAREEPPDGGGARTGWSFRAGVQWNYEGRFTADAGFLARERMAPGSDDDYENFRFSLGVGVQW